MGKIGCARQYWRASVAHLSKLTVPTYVPTGLGFTDRVEFWPLFRSSPLGAALLCVRTVGARELAIHGEEVLQPQFWRELARSGDRFPQGS